jgi:UPF0755 protein
MRYHFQFKSRRWPVMFIWFVGAIVALAIMAVVLVRHIYHDNLKPVSTVRKVHVINVPQGASVGKIASILKKDGVIRSDWAFQWYVSSQEAREKLQAGTYALRPNQSVPEIVNLMTTGRVTTALVTIPPGRRIDEVRSILINNGFNADQVDQALKADNYRNHPALVELPKEINSLEGYIYPESIQKDANTTPQQLITKYLDEMQKRLTPEIRNSFAAQGLNVYQGITLASMVEMEVSNPADRPIVAQVFLKRFHDGMVLGSDVTAFYGATLADKSPSVSFDSPYNTRLHPGLPPGPISNVSADSLAAVAHPASTDWVYFVAGDDGKTYFSHTLAEHETAIAAHCKKLCNSDH